MRTTSSNFSDRGGARASRGRASVTTDVPHNEHERYAGRAAPDQARPPGPELPSAGTGELNQVAASATLLPARHLQRSRVARAFTAIRIRPSTSRDSTESALRADRSSETGKSCRQEEQPDSRPSHPDELIPEPHEIVPRNRTPDTIAGWKAVADALLSDPCCAFHRNVEISSHYAWIYKLQPACFKWAAMDI